MDEGPITHPGVPQEVYHTLGVKTLWIFILQRIHAAAILFVLTIVLFALEKQPFLKSTNPPFDFTPYVQKGALIGLGLFIIVTAITLLIAWLIYLNYKFALGENSLKIKRGILNKEEVSVPYRQIQDIDIKRDLAFQLFGLSRIVILTAGHEDRDDASNDESEGILPALDSKLAEWLQAQLQDRTNVQKVTEVPAQPEQQ